MIDNTHFICDDNKTLHIENFNDNFCDCEDGQDENKTNACPNGKFYCKNKLFKSKNITTSKVL
jgi:protein kinase C substrate 80K-H